MSAGEVLLVATVLAGIEAVVRLTAAFVGGWRRAGREIAAREARYALKAQHAARRRSMA